MDREYSKLYPNFEASRTLTSGIFDKDFLSMRLRDIVEKKQA